MTHKLVRGTSNLLVANMYWMVAFKIHVSDASLLEETPNRHCVKSVQMRRNFWSEYRKILTKINSVFGHFSSSAI